MRRLSISSAGGLPRIAVRGLPLVLAAGLALAASACTAPSAKQGSAADRQAATVDPGSKSGAGGEKEKADPGSKSGAGGKSESWWQRMTRTNQEPKEKPWVYGDVRPGKGLLSNDDEGFVLLRKGEGQSSDPTKPQKVRR